MQDADIYQKTEAGREEIKSRAFGLSMSARAILLMVDGQRNVSAMRGIIAGSKAPADVLDHLVLQGLIEPIASSRPAPAPVAAPPAPVAPPPLVAAPPPPPAAAPPARPIAAPTPAAAAKPGAMPIRPIAPAPTPIFDGPLDLTLPTIYGPEHAAPMPPAVAQPAPIDTAMDASAPPSMDRYEHLYAMMNEIVRDFLAPHRRYFFQLKIERCTTATDLLELLYDLQTALSKSRGEAFASDVIARLRNAAV